MLAGSPPVATKRPLRLKVTPFVELLVVAVAAVIAAASYFVITGQGPSGGLLPPPLIAFLLVANIVPGVALMVLLGRRVARRRAARSAIGGEGQLHVRLVALFSVTAAAPILLVAIAASLFFQYGVEYSSSARARTMLFNARELVRDNYQRELDSVVAQTRAMSGDLAGYLHAIPIESLQFKQGLLVQTYQRELSEAMIIAPKEPNDPLAVLNPYGRPLKNIVTPTMLARFGHGASVLTVRSKDRIGAIVPLDYAGGTFLYASRVFDEQLSAQLRRGDAILADYRELQLRSRQLQLRFNAALLLVSLLIVGVAVWIALKVADRLVAPVADLVEAARRVEGGDLTARVVAPRSRDEVGTLAAAFNQMTGQLQQQTTALESRRAMIEAVMAGVSAGVISVAPDRAVRTINASAKALLDVGADPVGAPLVAIAPELDALLDGAERDAVVQVGTGADERTLAVRIARTEAGPILTFDDMTQQLHDQRRAAWSDVARRIAHEIKNPLTPIQLAAERLQRRYGKLAEPGDETFARLTHTIVRQVGDLRRMVDEFSSFARMPKPTFREESLVDIARQAMFLHEVAHPGVSFSLVHDDPGPMLVCDRRQIGQALTNLVKNAVEAIESKGREGGAVVMSLAEAPGQVTLTVEDTGVGLPRDRDRIVEPYVTTRARGTGLGLAIVQKIAEEHGGALEFADRVGGGAIVTLRFDTRLLAALDAGSTLAEPAGDLALASLSRDRT